MFMQGSLDASVLFIEMWVSFGQFQWDKFDISSRLYCFLPNISGNFFYSGFWFGFSSLLGLRCSIFTFIVFMAGNFNFGSLINGKLMSVMICIYGRVENYKLSRLWILQSIIFIYLQFGKFIIGSERSTNYLQSARINF